MKIKYGTDKYSYLNYFYLFIILMLFPFTQISAQAWDYTGIPYVTDNVPAAIMPTLPSSTNMRSAFPYDPCTIPTPIFNNGALQYYVDTQNGNDATAGNNGRGSVANPRQTFPGLSGNTWTIERGWQIFITNNSSQWNGNDITVRIDGASDNLCWIIGVNQGTTINSVADDGSTNTKTANLAELRCDKFFIGGQHYIIHGLRFKQADTADKQRIKFGNTLENVFSQYATVRFCDMLGRGNARGGAFFGGNGKDETLPAQFIVIYNNTIREQGDWRNGPDCHGIQPVHYVRYWWIINNEIYHCGGDAVQVNTSGHSGTVAGERPHYIYIAGNEMYENWEQSVDNKNCFHVIISENDTHDFYASPGAPSANNTSMILANDAEGPLASYQWAINNLIYDVGTGIKHAGTAAETYSGGQTSGQKSFAIGNVMWNVSSTGIVLDARGKTASGIRTWFDYTVSAFNTIHCGGQGIAVSRLGGDDSTAHYGVGNIVYSTGSPADADIELGDVGEHKGIAKYNVADRVSGTASITSSESIGNILNQDPQFTDLVNRDFTLQSSSPAVDMTNFNETLFAFDLFENMYGIDIKKDVLGTSRPISTQYDAGAYEHTTGGGSVTQFTLTTNVTGSGSIGLLPTGGTYDSASVVTLTAIPSSGWQFSHWTGDLTGSINPAQITMNSNKSVTAVFIQVTQFTLTTNVTGSGSVSLDPVGGTYDSASVVTLTAIPLSGWQFSHWTGDLSGSINPSQITMNSNKIVTAVFTESTVTQFTLTTNVTGSGNVELDPVGGTYDSATVVTLTATPLSGWQFDGWSGDLSGTTNPTQITMNANKSVTATFSEQSGGGTWTQLTYDDFELGFGNYTDGGGDCELYTGGTNAHQGNNAAMIKDNVGGGSSFYHTNGIDVDTEGYSQIRVIFWFMTSSYDSGQDDKFELKYYNGTAWQVIKSYRFENEVPANNTFYTDTVYISESTHTFPTDMKISFESTGTSNNGDQAFIDEVEVSAFGGSGTPVTQFTLTTNVTGSGSVELDPVGGTYDSASVVTLTAVPLSGWQFDGWSGDLSGTTNPAQITMNANKSVTATFIQQSGGGTWTQLTYDDFESGFGNYTDGGGDCELYTGGTNAHQGNNAAMIKDNVGGGSSFYHTNGIDVDTEVYTRIRVSFWFMTSSYDSGQDDKFELKYYNGTSWQVIKSYRFENEVPANNTFYTDTVYISESTHTFPTDMKISFESSGTSNNGDQAYIDEVEVSATTSLSKSSLGQESALAEGSIPETFTLGSYPNPFNPSTTIHYGVPKDSHIQLEIYDALGRKVAELYNGYKSAGSYSHVWNASDSQGRLVTSGVYLVVIRSSNFTQTFKLMYLR